MLIQAKRRVLWVLTAIALGITGTYAVRDNAKATHVQEGTVWTHVASACAVDEASDTRYDANLSSLQHRGTETGEILARCNVVNPEQFDMASSSAHSLQVNFQDPDGAENAYRVLVRLNRASNAGPTQVLATFDSNAPEIPVGPTEGFANFDHHFDFVSNAYYVTLRVIRSNTAQRPLVWNVRIARGIPVVE